MSFWIPVNKSVKNSDHYMVSSKGVTIIMPCPLADMYMHYHFDSFVMHSCGAKFQEHCFKISRDIVYSVFSTF